MFPVQIPRTDPNELLRDGDSSQLITAPKKDDKENAKADAALTDEIDQALWNDPLLRAMDYWEIDLRVKNGTLDLNGHITSTTSKIRIENAIRTIPGLLEIKNNLVLDDKLTLEVAASLGKLEQIYACKFFTGVSHGIVTLSGIVNDEHVKLLAEQCASSNSKTRGIINKVRVLGSALDLQDQPFLQPLIGEDISFLDGISGFVRQVIINPNNRRVTAMTVYGRFVSQQQDLKSFTDGEIRSPERLIVLSMDLVCYLTKFSGFLKINSNEIKPDLDFDSASFTSPDVNWVPPYPYRPEDVLFLVENQQMDENTENILDPLLLTVKAGAVLTEQLLANDSLGG